MPVWTKNRGIAGYRRQPLPPGVTLTRSSTSTSSPAPTARRVLLAEMQEEADSNGIEHPAGLSGRTPAKSSQAQPTGRPAPQPAGVDYHLAREQSLQEMCTLFKIPIEDIRESNPTFADFPADIPLGKGSILRIVKKRGREEESTSQPASGPVKTESQTTPTVKTDGVISTAALELVAANLKKWTADNTTAKYWRLRFSQHLDALNVPSGEPAVRQQHVRAAMINSFAAAYLESPNRIGGKKKKDSDEAIPLLASSKKTYLEYALAGYPKFQDIAIIKGYRQQAAAQKSRKDPKVNCVRLEHVDLIDSKILRNEKDYEEVHRMAMWIQMVSGGRTVDAKRLNPRDVKWELDRFALTITWRDTKASHGHSKPVTVPMKIVKFIGPPPMSYEAYQALYKPEIHDAQTEMERDFIPSYDDRVAADMIKKSKIFKDSPNVCSTSVRNIYHELLMFLFGTDDKEAIRYTVHSEQSKYFKEFYMLPKTYAELRE